MPKTGLEAIKSPEGGADAFNATPGRVRLTGENILTAGRFLPMRLQRLELREFRNFPALDLDLVAPRLLVIGANGQGKSNLLESVELLTSLRSHRSASDRDLIREGESCSRLRALTAAGDSLELRLRRSGGRQALRNGKTLERQIDLVGPMRCVGFSSLDLELVRGEPSLRRHWLDRVVLQLEPVYGALLSRYGRLLRQRSQLLRRRSPLAQQQALLDVFDEQMALVGTRLHRRRQRALRRLEPLAVRWQGRLGGEQEPLTCHYRSGTRMEAGALELDAEEPWRLALLRQLQDQRPEEARLGQCLVGPHRDEITLVLALKLAELDLVRQVVGAPPLLLLDDVLAELDPQRQRLLLAAVGEDHQCLVSATHLEAFAAGWRDTAQVVRLHAGRLETET